MKILASKVKTIPCPQCRERVDLADAKPFSKVPCPQCGHTLRVPVRMGRFLLTRQLGRGAMSRVYLAVDAALGRKVAIKVLGQESEGQKKLAQRCLEEARALASLNHPNVVQIHSVGQKRGQPYIVMELVEGVRLDRLISERGLVEEERVLEIAIGVAEGLRAAGRVGLVHGDVKPGNILVDRAGVPKLLDFGIARFEGKAPGQTVYGTPHYVAPEIARTRHTDMRSDIYSLGATMYHMLTGEYPFEGNSSKEIISARMNRPAKNVREIVPSLSRATGRVVARMMMTRPSDRHDSYEQLISELYEVSSAVRDPRGSDELDGLAEAIGIAHQSRGGSGRSSRRTRVLLKLAISALVAGSFGVLVGALIWFVTHRNSP